MLYICYSETLPMKKYKFTKEYELKASVKMLYPYFSTPIGLQEWFAEKVQSINPHTFLFHWDNEDHIGTITSQRIGKSIKFEFDKDTSPNPSYIEFRLEHNDLTNSTFVKITDYSDETDEEELNELWDGLIQKLKEIVGA